MSQESIASMIASALETLEDGEAGGPRSLPHAKHILGQYATLVAEPEPCEPDPRVEVALPVAPPAAAAAASAGTVAGRVRHTLGRLLRR